MKNQIQYVVGDATEPSCEGKKIIAHICNDMGAWGSGFVMAISNKWKNPEYVYRKAFEDFSSQPKLGSVIYAHVDVATDDPMIIANMIAQHKVKPIVDKPIRYEALVEALDNVVQKAIDNNASLHMPRIGSDRAGGDWNIIEKIINDVVCSRGIKVTVYDLPKKNL